MSPSRDRSLLQLHLPEDWPSPTATNGEFRYARFVHGTCVTGVAPLDAVPLATATIAVAPASSVVFVRVSLPAARVAKMARLLPLAVEDAIATAPEEVHAVLVEHVPGGQSLVAVVNKGWLAQVLGELKVHGIRPTRFIVETELAAHCAATDAKRPWLIVLSHSGGFASFGIGEIIALDLGDGRGSLPLALRLAREEHLRRGDTPDEIVVFTAPKAALPDVDAWSRALGLPVRNGGEWRPELIDGRALRDTDLLRGEFALTWSGDGLQRTFRFVGIGAAVILGMHVVLTGGDWWRLSSEARALKSQMETHFRQIFPETKAVVDAPLQIRRSLGRLRREAGVPDASDFVPLLAAVGPSLAAVGGHAERVRYERGELEVEVTLPAGEARETMEKRFSVPGYRVRVEQLTTTPTGNVMVLRVSVEA